MSIENIRPQDCPCDLRAKIELVAAREKISWRDAVLLLARKVVSPKK